MPNPIIKIKRGSTTPASLSAGELAVDLTNKTLFVGKADNTPLAIGGEGVFATITYVNSAVSSSISGLGTMAFQNANNVTITGGSISVGAITATSGAFVTLTASTAPTGSNDVVRKTDLDSAISALGSVFHFVGNTSLATTPFDLGTLPDLTTGAYYRVDVAGTFTDTGFSAAAKIGDSFVKTTTSWQKLDNVDAAITGTTNEIVVTGDEDIGYVVSIDSIFKTRVSDVETKTQNIDLTATTAGTTIVKGHLVIQPDALLYPGDFTVESIYGSGSSQALLRVDGNNSNVILGGNWSGAEVNVRSPKLIGVDGTFGTPSIENFIIDGGVY